ncbi:MYCBP-associated protein [Arapaima gigas]
MASLGKSTGKASRKEVPPRTPSEKKRLKTSEEFSDEQPHSPILKGEDIQALAIRLEDLEKLRTPQPPKEKTPVMTQVLVKRRRPQEEERKMVKVVVARPFPPDTPVIPLNYTDFGGPRFDTKGMLLPHSILGSLEDFKKEMEARGELELAKLLSEYPASRPSVAPMENVDIPERLSPPDQQVHALHHWQHHMSERQRQQDFLSQVLHKPVQHLLMNQSSRFRETQEQRELISRGLPALLFGQAFCGGSEFWNIPQRIGDELSGLMATLTQTERGNPEPVAHIGLPRRILEESGSLFPETSPSMYQTWDHSLYLQQRCQELKEVLKDLDFNQPEIDALEVIGSSRVFTSVTAEHRPLQDEEQREEEQEGSGPHKEHLDPPVPFADISRNATLIPALRFCGQPARWIGSSSSHRGELGIAARLTFEVPAGQQASSYLELQNDGNTAVYYSWQRLALPYSHPEMRRINSTQHFYFNSSPGVILPRTMRCIQFIFKSTTAGIFKEMWGLNTHPVLLGGALMRITLWGVSLYQDKNAEQREALQRDLLRKEAVFVCRQLLTELIRTLHPPPRPCSPMELFITEEERFHTFNPQLHYLHSTVEQLKHLWVEAVQGVEPGKGDAPPKLLEWDLSVSSLRQVLLALPEGDYKEEVLAHFNTLLVELYHPPQRPPPLSRQLVGLQLWRELLDRLVSEAMWHRRMLGLPETDLWGEEIYMKSKRHSNTPLHFDIGDKLRKGGMAHNGEKRAEAPQEKEERKGAVRHSTKDKSTEELHTTKKKFHEDKRPGKLDKEPDKEPVSKSNSPEVEPLKTPTEQEDFAEKEKLRRHLHRQVHVLLEALVDSLCELLGEEAQSSE